MSPDRVTAANERRRLRELLDRGVITAREHEILELRYAHRFSQYTVARALDITRSTVRSLERNALEKITRHEREEEAA